MRKNKSPQHLRSLKFFIMTKNEGENVQLTSDTVLETERQFPLFLVVMVQESYLVHHHCYILVC